MALARYVITAPATVPAAVTTTCPPRRVATRWCDPPPDELRTFAERAVRTGPIGERDPRRCVRIGRPSSGHPSVHDHTPFGHLTDSPFFQCTWNVPLLEPYRTLGLPHTGHFPRPLRIPIPGALVGVWLNSRRCGSCGVVWIGARPVLVVALLPPDESRCPASALSAVTNLTRCRLLISDPRCPLNACRCSCKVPGSSAIRSLRTRNCRTSTLLGPIRCRTWAVSPCGARTRRSGGRCPG
jgi:hypothetical protein